MNRTLEEPIREAVIEENRSPHRTVYIPGEDPEELDVAPPEIYGIGTSRTRTTPLLSERRAEPAHSMSGSNLR